MNTHVYKVQQKVWSESLFPREEDDEIFEFIKKNINGWAFTPIERNEFTTRLQKEVGDKSLDKKYAINEDLKLELTTRIEAFKSGFILFNPVFECDTCDTIARWDSISRFSDYSKLRCISCSSKNEAMADDSKDFGTGKVKLSCSFWRYEGNTETVKELHHAVACNTIFTEKDMTDMLPKNAKPIARQVVTLMSESQVKIYYCMQMHEFGPRIMTLPQIIKHDPQLALNALLHGRSAGVQSVFASLLGYYCNMFQVAQAYYLNMNNIDAERFNEKREDIIIPIEARSILTEFNIMS